MGLKVPAYSYYAARGQRNLGPQNNPQYYNGQSRQALDRFFNLLTNPLVREIGIRAQAVYNNEHRISEIEWRAPRPVAFELDIDNRPQLETLIEAIGRHAALVIPSLKHLKSGNLYCRRLMDRFCETAIAPLSVEHLKNRIERLEIDLRRPLEELRADLRFEEDVKRFFVEATVNGVDNLDTLKNSLVHRPRRIRARLGAPA